MAIWSNTITVTVLLLTTKNNYYITQLYTLPQLSEQTTLHNLLSTKLQKEKFRKSLVNMVEHLAAIYQHIPTSTEKKEKSVISN